MKFLALFLAAGALAAPTQDDSNKFVIQRRMCEFSIQMHNFLLTGAAGESVIFSPVNIYAALSLIHLGSKGDTKNEIGGFLGINATFNETLLHGNFGQILRHVKSSKHANVSLADGIFVQNGFNLKDQFKKDAIFYYDNEIKNVDFSQAEAKAVVNKWVNEITNGRIPEMYKEEINAQTVLALVTAIYFSGYWKYPFQKEETITAPFYVSDTKTVNVPFLTNQNTLRYLHYAPLDMQVLSIPFRDDEFHFDVILPPKTQTLDVFMRNLKVDHFDFVHRMTPTLVSYKMPKFKFERRLELKTLLTTLGLGSLFQQPDLSGISDQSLSVGEAKHVSEIELTETGVLASAATSIGVSAVAKPPAPPVEFVIDRPFVFFIFNVKTKVIVFWGSVQNPSLINEIKF